MYTLEFKISLNRRVIVNHNSDWSGEAIIVMKDKDNVLNKYRLPGKLLLALGENAYKDYFVRKAISLFEDF